MNATNCFCILLQVVPSTSSRKPLLHPQMKLPLLCSIGDLKGMVIILCSCMHLCLLANVRTLSSLNKLRTGLDRSDGFDSRTQHDMKR